MLAERGVALEVIWALAGHIDIRTTQIYVDVTDQCKSRRHRCHSRDQ
jgi:site-specific recombinase XerD